MAKSKASVQSGCPCGLGDDYSQCCGRFIEGRDVPATAEQLMRSRYTAYVQGNSAYVLLTWHPSARPALLELESGSPRWLGLEVKRHEQVNDTNALVEFVARFREGSGKASRMQELSRFVRDDGRWYYVEAMG